MEVEGGKSGYTRENNLGGRWRTFGDPGESLETITYIVPAVSTNVLLERDHDVHQHPDVDMSGFVLGRAPIYFFAQPHGSGLTEYMGIVDYPLGSAGLNQLLFALSPFQAFGLDTRDILSDWQMPDRQDRESQRLLALHQRHLKMWSEFERYRKKFLQVIQEKDAVAPMIHWFSGPTGRVWDFAMLGQNPKSRFTSALLSSILPEIWANDPSQWNPVVGEWAVAYFSPRILEIMKRQTSQRLDPNRRQQFISPTQAGAFVLENYEKFIVSGFFPRAEKYIWKSDSIGLIHQR